MKFKRQALTLTLLSGFILFSHVTSVASADAEAKGLQPTQEQSMTVAQLSKLVDRTHYLNQRLDAKMSERVLSMYFDQLDPEHSIFLATDVAEYTKKYGATFGDALKKGDLKPAFEIYNDYQQRITAYYQYSLEVLKKPIKLNGTGELVVDREKSPFFTSREQQQAYWNKVITSQMISLTISHDEMKEKREAEKRAGTLLTEGVNASKDLAPVDILKARYEKMLSKISRQDSDRVTEVVLNSLLATYDPHSSFFAPVQAMEMNRQSNLTLEGIGVSIRPDKNNEDYTRVESIVEGGPSQKQGQIKVGDLILAVAQDKGELVDVVGWSSGEIVGLIRGKRGTKVTLKVVQSGASLSQARLITITRGVIEEKESGVKSRVVDIVRDNKTYKIGVLDIPSFYFNYKARQSGGAYRSVSEDTFNALIQLNAQNVDGLVVDLRNDPGGSLDEVARMVGMFIKSGPTVQIRDSNGAVKVYQDEDGGQVVFDKPMSVIINLASASASEIFSAAIQDYGRGVVVGSTTYGKGTAQIQLDGLAFGQATLTQRKFYRVTGGSTQNKGVIPDIPFVSVYGDEFGERKSKNPLQWDAISTSAFKPEGDITPILGELNQRSKQRTKDNIQFQYLNQLRILTADKDKKTVSLNIADRKAEIVNLQNQTLALENIRRRALKQQPYPTWLAYQTAMDAQSDLRSKMKEADRPALPEEEVFVTETAQVVVDQLVLNEKKAP